MKWYFHFDYGGAQRKYWNAWNIYR